MKIDIDKLWFANQVDQLMQAEDEILSFGAENQVKGMRRLHAHIKMLQEKLTKG